MHKDYVPIHMHKHTKQGIVLFTKGFQTSEQIFLTPSTTQTDNNCKKGTRISSQKTKQKKQQKTTTKQTYRPKHLKKLH